MDNDLGSDGKRSWLNKNARVFTGLATIALAVIGLVGLIFIVSELKELRRQNSYIESSVRQTYRPLGVVHCDPEQPGKVNLVAGYTPEFKDKFALAIPYYVRNYGPGLLSYIGRFSYLSSQSIDFRSRFLGGDIKTVVVDAYYSYARRTTLLPYDADGVSRIETEAIFNNIRFEDKYFVYSLFLYEDQQGNLYDTEHLTVIPFLNAEVEGDRLVARLDTTKGIMRRDTYHSYSAEERKSLVAAFRALDEPKDHPLADVIDASE